MGRGGVPLCSPHSEPLCVLLARGTQSEGSQGRSIGGSVHVTSSGYLAGRGWEAPESGGLAGREEMVMGGLRGPVPHHLPGLGESERRIHTVPIGIIRCTPVPQLATGRDGDPPPAGTPHPSSGAEQQWAPETRTSRRGWDSRSGCCYRPPGQQTGLPGQVSVVPLSWD